MAALTPTLGTQALSALLGAPTAALPGVTPLISPLMPPAVDVVQAQLLQLLLSGSGTISLCTPVATITVSPPIAAAPTLQLTPAAAAAAPAISPAISPFISAISPFLTTAAGRVAGALTPLTGLTGLAGLPTLAGLTGLTGLTALGSLALDD